MLHIFYSCLRFVHTSTSTRIDCLHYMCKKLKSDSLIHDRVGPKWIQLDCMTVWTPLGVYAYVRYHNFVAVCWRKNHGYARALFLWMAGNMAGRFWTNEESKALLGIWAAANVQAHMNGNARKLYQKKLLLHFTILYIYHCPQVRAYVQAASHCACGAHSQYLLMHAYVTTRANNHIVH